MSDVSPSTIWTSSRSLMTPTSRFRRGGSQIAGRIVGATILIQILMAAITAVVDTGTRGTYYLDAFESRRQTYIGP